MEHNAFDALLDKYLTGDLSQEEQQKLASLIEQPENAPLLDHFVQQVMVAGTYEEDFPSEIKDRLNKFLAPHLETPVRSIRRRWWIAAAAVVVAIIAGTWLLKMTDAGITDHSKEQVIAGTVLPGSNKATLTLSDGHIITLDSTINSTITEQNGIKIINLASGRLSYKSGIIKSKIVKSFNTLTTPRGGQYQVILPDGTQVWLNAASSITYPTAFTGDRREVSITGEVYMEVTTDKTKPFIVQAREIAIEVLGTHFNINAYADEPAIQTTLLEGSVRVTSQSTVIYHPSSVILIPGQQARLIPGTSLQLVQADASQVVAWKNGIFQFNKSPLPVVLRHLSRWYDMEIVYKSEVPTLHVGGKMQRNLPLADVLDVLKRVGVQFKIEGNKLIVLEQ